MCIFRIDLYLQLLGRAAMKDDETYQLLWKDQKANYSCLKIEKYFTFCKVLCKDKWEDN